MNWDAVGALAELVGAVAVVVSLIYLAGQVRVNSRQVLENSRHVQASVYHSTNSAFTDWMALIANNESLAALWSRILEGDDFDRTENVRVHSLLSILFLAYEVNFKQQSLGVVTRETFDLPALRDLIQQPVIAQWWELNGPRIFTVEFRSEVERIRTTINQAKP